MILIIGVVFMLIGMFVSSRLKSKFAEYSRVGLSNGLSGAEIAEKMLHDNNIYDVRITQVDGELTDHYNPADKTVNLSSDVYHGRSVSAAAVAAHECGHAVQHATAYAALKMRSAMVPAVNVASNVMRMLNMFLMFGGIYMLSQGSAIGNLLLIVLIIANAAITAFSLITLPVEYDASKRALAWMTTRNIVNNSEHGMAKDALDWAARTYVVGALAAIANLMYYVMLFLGRRDD
ncbi:MAG: zinc metallopeptidase [Cytophagaceae bacterium]|nr:zinc metallopeptidase [Cytophagaceae bacterium]MBK9509706.1 zinc metallopeptidase [Cytophagaceae bacterium]MBK9933208.1 zinc metallopeptidase [Cytophagaceae bacterium]MBL0303075.1 zinc metallopeptidase [Cytophagaceae bacterium]MBL0325919.1 zinc metallopeptidase [Cytophagaceae bacterium]